MVNITLCLDREVPGVLYRQVEAYDLAKGNTWDRLNAVARQQGMTPLDTYWGDPDYGDLPQEQRLALLLHHWDEEVWGERPERQPRWFDAANGLEAVRALRAYLKEHPRAIRSGKRDLRQFEEALQRAQEHQALFRLYADV
jgi:hypothetical protein